MECLISFTKNYPILSSIGIVLMLIFIIEKTKTYVKG